ncbi:hypothetical protein DL96DRAFT_1717951 [Flagelloscypha sp. PMI_526]|nr:hypothetical protein DL96DRAFT_1717951 [Flagelloscypha sp. PMI_526]
MASARPTTGLKRERPGSQIYIGNGTSTTGSFGSVPLATPPEIPDLPEPPSPNESIGSGLPSPPATNSTGSGSTGDPSSVALRSNTGRRPSIGLGLGINGEGRLFQAAMALQRSVSGSSAHQDHPNFDDIDDDNFGDGEDDTARLGSVNDAIRQSEEDTSEATLQRVKSLSERNRMALNKLSSISRLSSPARRSPAPLPPSPAMGATPLHKRHSQSGSETERESVISSSNSRSHLSSNNGLAPLSSTLSRNSTLTLRHRSGTITPPPNPARARLVSAPASPGKALSNVRNNTARKRVSMASYPSHDDEDSDDPEVIHSYSSNSPTNLLSSGGRRRNPLPREFVEGSSRPPQTPSRRTLSRASVRQSADYTNSTPAEILDGRRQSLRGGSAESALFAARSLGLTRRDPNDEGGSARRRERAGTVTASAPPPKSAVDFGTTPGRSTTLGDYGTALREHRTGPTPSSLRVNGGRESSLSRDLQKSPSKRDMEMRPPTSLSRYHQSASRPTSMTIPEREAAASPSPYSSRRFTAPPPASSSSGHSGGGGSLGGGTEHTKLLIDALNIFSGHLSRQPASSSTAKDAHSAVYTAERLNGLLRLGTTSALESQIDASTEGDAREAELWKKVGGEYREAMRVSDELVRSLTGLLLGLGRVLKESEEPQQSQPDFGHGRVSAEGRRSVEPFGRRSAELVGNGGGRRSGEYREVEREDALRKLDGRASAALLGRDRDAIQPSPMQQRRDRGTPPPPPATPSAMRTTRPGTQRSMTMAPSNPPPSATSRRAQQRSSQGEEQTSPPPPPPRIIQTKPSRQSIGSNDRSRTLPPISIPKPIPTLPSESSHRRSATTTASTRARSGTIETPTSTTMSRRRGLGALGVATPTTAVTPHHVSGSGGMETSASKERLAFPSISRQNSNNTESSSSSSRQHGRSTTYTSSGSSSLLNSPEQQQFQEEGSVRRRMGSVGKAQGVAYGKSNAADRSAAAALLTQSGGGGGGGTKARRKTVTEIWSNGDS